MAVKEVAVAKRAKISSAQKVTMLAALGASLMLGLAIVMVNYFYKIRTFNKTVIDEYNAAATTYGKVIEAAGICKPPKDSRDKIYTMDELKKCEPNKITAEELPGSLRYNVLFKMSQNADLEAVGREALTICYDEKGEKIDFNKRHAEATTDVDRARYTDLVKMCSALRVIPEALPAKKNVEALMASLNHIFLVSKWEPETLTPGDDGVTTGVAGVGIIPAILRIETDGDKTRRILENVERSIRMFDINTASVEWSGKDRLEFSAQATAYYAEEEVLMETTKNVTLDSGAATPKKGKK